MNLKSEIRPHLRAVISFGSLAAGMVCLMQVPKLWEGNLQAVITAANERDPFAEALRGQMVVIDAGHGGQDSGTSGHGVEEKYSTLDIAKRVESRLKRLGISTHMTRDSDTYIELEDRSAMTAKLKAAAFISIHLNASTAAEVAGLETYFCSQRASGEAASTHARLTHKSSATVQDQRSELLASMIQRRVCSTTGAADRGTRDSRLYVVLHSSCPAVLVECGYLTNVDESRLLKHDAYKEKLAMAVADSVRQYLLVTAMNPRRGFVLPDSVPAVVTMDTGITGDP
ncbi:MAG: N-acetylmuramoyl-L-alanine amidase [Verrucomicrobiaceae bacterium]